MLVVLLLEWEQELPTPLEMREHFALHFQMPLLVQLRFVVHFARLQQQCSCLASCSPTLSWAWLPLAGSPERVLVQDQVWLAGQHFDSEGSG